MEDESRRLEEQNRLAGFQFQKLGEESSRLLSACEVERDLRSKLEAALHIKERQVRPPSAFPPKRTRSRTRTREHACAWHASVLCPCLLLLCPQSKVES